MSDKSVLEVKAIWVAVWAFRVQWGDIFLTPSPVDCLRYAFTEMGEAMDAALRQDRKEDARDREDDTPIAEELADVLIMLVSAIGDVWDSRWKYPFPDKKARGLDFFAREMGILLSQARESPSEGGYGYGHWREKAFFLAVEIAYHMKTAFKAHPTGTVSKRLVRIYDRRIKPVLEEGE